MISKKFTTYALASALALTTAFSTPAMAGNTSAECLPADKAKIVISKDSGVKIGDFTKSSAACLQKYANGMSRTQLLLVADGDYQAWRDVNIEAAKQLRQEGKPTNVFFTGDTDGIDNTANTVFWANGVKRDITPVEMQNGTKIYEIAAAPDIAVNTIKGTGQSVFDTYLKRVPDLALNQ